MGNKLCVEASIRLADDDDDGWLMDRVDAVHALDADVNATRFCGLNLGHNGKHKEHFDTEHAETCNVWTRSIEYGDHLHFAPNNV